MRLLIFLVLFSFISCSTDDSFKIECDVSEFILSDDLQIEVVASEPLLDSPVAMSIDSLGRFWIVEMPGYMRDINGSDEDVPDGRIVLLSDNDNDGKFENRQVIIDKLNNPRAICLIDDGFLYTDSTALIFASVKETTITSKEVVDEHYVIGGNIEHRPNGLLYNIDNWIYSAKSNVRYQKKNNKWIKEATSFRGQWGISSDMSGRLIYNHNSAPFLGDNFLPNSLLDNHHLELEHNIGKYLTDDMRLYPIQATAVNRGYEKGVLDEQGVLTTFTSACSPYLFYGKGLGDKYYADGFVCAPEANLISQYEIDYHSLTAKKDSLTPEFLVSKDETFRPVQILAGYDDAMYVLDMRKGIIQHTAYMSSYLRSKILGKGLEKINGKGRIYKITRKDQHSSSQHLSNNTSDLIDLLNHKNLELRRYAHKRLTNKDSIDIVPKIKSKVEKIIGDKNINHHLWVLEYFNAIDPSYLLSLPIENLSSQDLISVLPLIEKYDAHWVYQAPRQFIDIYSKLLKRDDRAIDLQLAPIFTNIANYWPQLTTLAKKNPEDVEMNEALVSSAKYFDLYTIINSDPSLVNINKSISIAKENKSNKISFAPTINSTPHDDDRTNGMKYFKKYCSSCHGMDGKGQKKMAPSIVNSQFLQNPEKELAAIILGGYKSEDSQFQMLMPKYIDDPNMSDQDVADIISYLLSTFAKRWGGISKEEVGKIRSQLKEQKQSSSSI